MTHEERLRDMERLVIQYKHESAGITLLHVMRAVNYHLREVAEEAKREAQPEPRWIPCSERMPTRKDGDCQGQVWWHERCNERVSKHAWDADYYRVYAAHWMPTGLRRPEPPNDQKLSHAAGDFRQPETRSENRPA